MNESNNQDKSNSLAVKRYGSVVSMPLAFSSLRIARLIHAETEASPSSFSALSIPFSSAGSTRKPICLLPLGLFVIDTRCTLDYHLVALSIKCMTPYTQKQQSLAVLSAPARLLTTTVKRLTNMATNQFTFILAQGKQLVADLQEIRFVSVLAATEQEARQLIGHSNLVFTSRKAVAL